MSIKYNRRIDSSPPQKLRFVASHRIDFGRQNHFQKRKPNMMENKETTEGLQTAFEAKKSHTKQALKPF